MIRGLLGGGYAVSKYSTAFLCLLRVCIPSYDSKSAFLMGILYQHLLQQYSYPFVGQRCPQFGSSPFNCRKWIYSTWPADFKRKQNTVTINIH